MKTCLLLAFAAVGLAMSRDSYAGSPQSKSHAAPSAGQSILAKQNRINREYFERLLTGPTGKPGVWIDMQGGQISRITKSVTGFVRTTTDVYDDGTVGQPAVITYAPDDARGIFLMRANGRTFSMQYTREDKDTYRLVRLIEPNSPDVAVFTQLTHFSDSGREVVTGGETAKYVWLSEAHGREQQNSYAQLTAARSELKRKEAELTALKEQVAREDDIQRREQEEMEQQALVAQYEGQRQAAAAQWEAEARQRTQDLEDSIQRLRDSTARYEDTMNRLKATTPRPGGFDGSAANARDAGARNGHSKDEERLSPSMPPAATNTASGPLRFVLSIGLQPRTGDSINPTCYSNVITRPGPPGWGQRGFLPPGSAQAAQDAVQEMKSRFIAACRSSSGRDVTSEGDFHWTWNETRDGDAQIANARAQYREDVSVSL